MSATSRPLRREERTVKGDIERRGERPRLVTIRRQETVRSSSRKYGNKYFLHEVLCGALPMKDSAFHLQAGRTGSRSESATSAWRSCRGSPYRSEVMSIAPGKPEEMKPRGHPFFCQRIENAFRAPRDRFFENTLKEDLP